MLWKKQQLFLTCKYRKLKMIEIEVEINEQVGRWKKNRNFVVIHVEADSK
jgi:hypothetical protein